MHEDYIGDIRTGGDTSLAEQTFFLKNRVVEMTKALTQMKTWKATGLDDILIEASTCLGEIGRFGYLGSSIRY